MFVFSSSTRCFGGVLKANQRDASNFTAFERIAIGSSRNPRAFLGPSYPAFGP